MNANYHVIKFVSGFDYSLLLFSNIISGDLYKFFFPDGSADFKAFYIVY